MSMKTGWTEPIRMSGYDAIVIGAGPAGLTTARDLRSQGYSVLVLEARDRIGGRTWTNALQGYDGESIELGGTYIRPKVQHNIAREIQRYDQPLAVGAGEWQSAGFRIGGVLKTVPIPPDQIVALERAIMAMATACKRIDANADVTDQYLSDLDVPIDDFFAPYRLPQATREFLYGIIAGVAQCDVREVSMLQWLVWMAGDGSPLGMFFSVTDEKLQNGMSELWTAMAQDAELDIALGCDVATVSQDAVSREAGSVLVRTATGEEHRARVCIVAVGSQVLHRIEFLPGLDVERRRLIDGQYIAPGFKTFLVVEDAPSGFMGFGGFSGSGDPRIGWLYEERKLQDGRRLLLAWGTGEMPSLDEARDAIHDFLPGATVTAVAGHDWARDEFAQGINHFHRPGEALRFASIVGKPHGRVLFAGGDVSRGIWGGWIEGALDSGRVAAQDAAALLRADRRDATP